MAFVGALRTCGAPVPLTWVLDLHMATRKPIKELLISTVFTFIGVGVLIAQGMSWAALCFTLFFAACSIVLARALKEQPANQEQKFAPAASEIFEHEIAIARYPYKHATVYGSLVKIPANRITGLFSSPGEAAFILDSKEVIFLAPEQKEHLNAFAQRNGITSLNAPDIWGLLSEPFLDTEYTEADRLRDYQTLGKLGFSQAEVKKLRRKIFFTMHSLTFATWEWRFYSTDDLLRAYATINPFRFTKKFYWQVMEVALRPYHLS